LRRYEHVKEMSMRCLIVAFAALAALSSGAMAQTAASDADHTAHHPAGASAPAAPTKAPTRAAPKPAAKASAPSMPQMTATMKSMQEMHDKMMAAKTPEERQALMAEHMKAMQDGMAMMGQMRGGQGGNAMGGGMPMGSEMMGKRMDMMEMMMQMMMDREAVRSAPMK
jgi:hypothetical protein